MILKKFLLHQQLPVFILGLLGVLVLNLLWSLLLLSIHLLSPLTCKFVLFIICCLLLKQVKTTPA